MNKAFTKESDEDLDDLPEADAMPEQPAGPKNYITPAGYKRLRDEFDQLWEIERPKLVDTVAWAAGNGDRSENGDYIYGKKRLREVDRRIRFLSRRIESAVVVDNVGQSHERVFFGATVCVVDRTGAEKTLSIVGLDEVDPARGRISWISPVAKALLKAHEGDVISVRTPGGMEELEVREIRYETLD